MNKESGIVRYWRDRARRERLRDYNRFNDWRRPRFRRLALEQEADWRRIGRR